MSRLAFDISLPYLSMLSYVGLFILKLLKLEIIEILHWNVIATSNFIHPHWSPTHLRWYQVQKVSFQTLTICRRLWRPAQPNMRSMSLVVVHQKNAPLNSCAGAHNEFIAKGRAQRILFSTPPIETGWNSNDRWQICEVSQQVPDTSSLTSC